MKLLIDHQGVEARTAVIDENGLLQALSVDTLTKKQLKGNIYLAKILKIEPGIGAVFLDYGEKKSGFLPLSQLKKLISQEDNLKNTVGQNILVQVIKEERSNKGAAFTIEISLAGHYCILLPFENSVGGVSRKIKSALERERLKKIVDKIVLPSYMNVIVRTSAEQKLANDIRKDIRDLQKLWNTIVKKAQAQKTPILLHEEKNVFEKAIRDMPQKDIDEILVQGTEAFKQVKKFVRSVIPSCATKVREYNENEKDSLFNIFHINEQIENLISPLVSLPSGGTIVIQQTEALVSIDVNSASHKNKTQDETNRNTNKEACLEIARQIQLRDLSGIIVIDFIDMEDPEDEEMIYRTLKLELKLDKARIHIEPMNAFGMIELTRQRSKKNLSDHFMQKCPCCLGYGIIRTKESMSMTILRAIEKKAYHHPMNIIHTTSSKEICDYMQNYLRKELLLIEQKYHVTIQLASVWHVNIAAYNIQTEPYKTMKDEEPEHTSQPKYKRARMIEG